MELKGKNPLDIASCPSFSALRLKLLIVFAYLPVMARLNHICKTLRSTWIKSSAVVISIKSAILHGYCIVLSWRLLYYLVSKIGNDCGITEVVGLELSISPDKECI